MARHFSFQSISLPLTGTADAASGITVAAMEKKSSHVGTAGAVSASRAVKKTMQPFARASSASARLCPPSHGHSPPEFWPFLPVLGSLWFSIQPQNYFS